MFPVFSPCRKLPFPFVPSRSKKYYPGWRDPFSLTDYDNLSKGNPSVTDQWETEWSSAKVVLYELKAFDINRLPHHLVARDRRIPLPVKYDHERRLAYQRRLFGVYGLSSGVNPCELLDSYEYLARENVIKRRLEPDIEEFKRGEAEKNVAKAKVEEERYGQSGSVSFSRLFLSYLKGFHDELVPSSPDLLTVHNLQRLPEIMGRYRANQVKKAQAAQAQEEKRRKLLEEACARDRFGYYVDHRDPKFLKLVEEKHDEAKLARKASKKK
ncbi:unnamed protein product [Taenia asiatica]|uniref:Large ribosomal subunit protein mL64 n=1 Tax=Taenia asiatica TaxID=60517 RepID=A0A158R9Y8_TAEAS|nr:unnamed protein product [Taenia asiatica]